MRERPGPRRQNDPRLSLASPDPDGGLGNVAQMTDTPLRGRADAVALGEASRGESRWPALTAVLVAIALQLVLPQRITRGLGDRPLIPALEGALLIVLLVANPGRISKRQAMIRSVSLALIALISVANVVSLSEVIHALLYSTTKGRTFVYGSVPVWLTNIIVFGLWYWELDRGGPAARQTPGHGRPDFLFPQMSTPGLDPGWAPTFVDYLYVAFTNATAFSPTDSMPLTTWAKLLMALQSLASLVIFAVVVSRAVSILR
jgi:hypothetical protein